MNLDKVYLKEFQDSLQEELLDIIIDGYFNNVHPNIPVLEEEDFRSVEKCCFVSNEGGERCVRHNFCIFEGKLK